METNAAAAAVGVDRFGTRGPQPRAQKTAAFELVEGSLKDGTARLRQISALGTTVVDARAEISAKKFRGIAVIMRIEEVRAGAYEQVSYKTIDLAKAAVEPPATPPAA